MKANGKFVKCHNCKKEIYRSKCFLTKNKMFFCSHECYNAYWMANATTRKIAFCENCGKTFYSHRSRTNGKYYWEKCCSMRCREEIRSRNRIYIKCKYCNKKILTYKKKIGRKKFCSHDCANAYKTAISTFMDKCLCCGKEIKVTKSREKRRVKGSFCCKECMYIYQKREGSPQWKGGYSVHESGVYMIAVGLSGKKYSGHPYGHLIYKARYRAKVEIYLGRLLRTNEYILHINNDNIDDRYENLYVCGSNSEHQRYIHGSLCWPKKSNLDEIKKVKVATPKIKYNRFSDNLIVKYIKNSESR